MLSLRGPWACSPSMFLFRNQLLKFTYALQKLNSFQDVSYVWLQTRTMAPDIVRFLDPVAGIVQIFRSRCSLTSRTISSVIPQDEPKTPTIGRSDTTANAKKVYLRRTSQTIITLKLFWNQGTNGAERFLTTEIEETTLLLPSLEKKYYSVGRMYTVLQGRW